MRCELAYGRGKLAVELPRRHVVKVLGIHPAAPLDDPSEEIREKLLRPTGTAPLADMAAGKQSACIVVSDITRPVPNQIVLPPILKILEEAGIVPENIVILVGTGLHRASTPEEKLEMLGEAIIRRYRVEDHDAKNESEHRFLGESSGGVPIWIDRRYLEADLKILTGLIEPHFMAGFSGGRKSICPAIAGAETILAWHSPSFLEHENARYGCMDENPVHTELMEIARKIGCDFIVNVVIDPLRNIQYVAAGEMDRAHRQGVDFARRIVTDTVPKPVDVVITSAAGYPLDKTWYQSVKGIVGAIDILKPGGTIILASACDEGYGSREFEEIGQQFQTIGEFMEAICSGSFRSVDQWQVEELAKALKKGRVKVVSDGLSAEQFEQFFVTPVDRVERAVAEAIAEYGDETTIAVLPDGPYVLAEIG